MNGGNFFVNLREIIDRESIFCNNLCSNKMSAFGKISKRKILFAQKDVGNQTLKDFIKFLIKKKQKAFLYAKKIKK